MSLHYLLKYECQKTGGNRSKICVGINDKSQDSTTKHFSYELLFCKFIIKFAGEEMFEIGEHPAKLQAKWLRFVLLCQLATADVRATNGAPVQVRSEPATTRHSSPTVVSTSAVAETTTLVTGAFGRNTTSNDTSADSADDTVRSHDRCMSHT